jgi:hypothetical protein
MPETFTVEQFAARIRSKYPGAYDALPDAELTERVLTKYPQYASSVRRVPAGPPAAVVAPSFLGEARQYYETTTPGEARADIVRGGLRGAGSTAYHLTELANRGLRLIPGVNRLVPAFPPKPEVLTPKNLGEKVGYVGVPRLASWACLAGQR